MKICCIETKMLPAHWVSGTHALAVDFFASHDTMQNDTIRWIERGEAEIDPAYKQIIPYIIVRNSNNEFLCYLRHGTEERLHGLYSCGIGGHIEEADRGVDLAQTIAAGIGRELSEEISNLEQDSITLVYKGIINETESDVGRVHLGVVYLASCREGYTPQAGKELAGMEWKTHRELSSLKKERWSDLAFQLIQPTSAFAGAQAP
jgi:predicted NUDIX family phosphoesterase